MISQGALAVFAWAVVELVLLGWVVSVLGGWNVLLLSVGAVLMGVVFVRRGVRGMVEAGLRPGPGSRPGHEVPRHALLAFAGLLLIIPGLLSGAAGALLAVPPVRALVGTRLSSHVARIVVPVTSPWGSAFGGARGQGDVVDVDLVNEDITRTARGSEGPSELR